jgi:hypothetical protein
MHQATPDRRGPERARPPPLGAVSDRARRRRCLFGFVPGLPEVKLDPEVVLVVFLPPLLYGESIFANFRDFRANLRALTLSTVGLVLA